MGKYVSLKGHGSIWIVGDTTHDYARAIGLIKKHSKAKADIAAKNVGYSDRGLEFLISAGIALAAIIAVCFTAGILDAVGFLYTVSWLNSFMVNMLWVSALIGFSARPLWKLSTRQVNSWRMGWHSYACDRKLQKLTTQTKVISIDTTNVPLHILALGGTDWLQEHQQYGDIIDGYLTSPTITRATELTSQDGITAELKNQTFTELQRIARENVHFEIAERESSQEEVHKARESSLKRAIDQSREVNRQVLEDYIRTELKTVVTPAQIDARQSKPVEQ